MMKPIVSTLFLLCGVSALSGCGVIANHPVRQITLAIYSPLCIDVSNASTADEAPVQVNPCTTGKPSQEWQLNAIADTDKYNIVNVNSQLCMSVLDAPDTTPHQKVVQETCAGNSQQNQIWSMVKAPTGEAGYRFISAASEECLDLPYGAAASVFELQQYLCTDNDPAQGWVLNYVVSGAKPDSE